MAYIPREQEEAIRKAYSGVDADFILDFFKTHGKVPYASNKAGIDYTKAIDILSAGGLGRTEEKPRTQEELTKIVEKLKDEPNLTEQELAEKSDALRELGKIPSTENKQLISNRATELKNNLHAALSKNSQGVLNEQQVNDIANRLATDILSGKVTQWNYDENNPASLGWASDLAQGGWRGIAKGFANEAKNILKPIEYYQGKTEVPEGEIPKDIKRVQDQLTAMRTKGASEAEVEDYLSKLPSELQAGREQFIAGETERSGARFREQTVPRSLEALGQRGALYSGDVEDLLTTQAFGVQNDLAGLKYQLEQQDNEFYFNAAYRDKVKKILESNLDVRQALGQERQNVLLCQQRQFQQGQQQLDIQSDERLARQGYERQARAQEAQARRQRDQQERQQRQGMYGNLGQTLGTLGGIAVAPATGGASLAIPAITGAGGRALGEGFG